MSSKTMKRKFGLPGRAWAASSGPGFESAAVLPMTPANPLDGVAVLQACCPETIRDPAAPRIAADINCLRDSNIFGFTSIRCSPTRVRVVKFGCEVAGVWSRSFGKRERVTIWCAICCGIRDYAGVVAIGLELCVVTSCNVAIPSVHVCPTDPPAMVRRRLTSLNIPAGTRGTR